MFLVFDGFPRAFIVSISDPFYEILLLLPFSDNPYSFNTFHFSLRLSVLFDETGLHLAIIILVLFDVKDADHIMDLGSSWQGDFIYNIIHDSNAIAIYLNISIFPKSRAM